ncbi:phosphate acetyltransferase [Nocardia sp. NPDC003482]
MADPAPSTVYIASLEGDTGKSTVALGMLHLLSATTPRVGVFRPIMRSGSDRDYILELLLEHCTADIDYDQAVGVTYEEVHTDPDAAISEIVMRFHEVAKVCDAVVIVGSDYTDVASPSELRYNARIAVNLGAPVLLVLRGAGRSPAEIVQVAELCESELAAEHAQAMAIVVNRCDPDALDAVDAALGAIGTPSWTLPEVPLLTAPTMTELCQAIHGEMYSGDPELMQREALSVMVGGMTAEHILERLTDGVAVIVPGDRSDALLALVNAHEAEGFPSLSGIIMNGGLPPDPAIARLIQGLKPRLPILTTELGTFDTANAAARTRGRVSLSSIRKVDTALALMEQRVDGRKLVGLIEVPVQTVVTPQMFEYQLVERAREDRRRIVLPEGDDDRILRAAGRVLQRKIADLTILGDEAAVRGRAAELGVDIDAAQVLDPRTSDLRDRFAETYAELRKHKGVRLERARELISDISYFGTMMVYEGIADGMVSGAAHTTAHTIRPALEIIKTEPGVSTVSSVFLMCLADRVLAYGDCAVVPDPTAEQLADIAISSARTAAQFGIEPRVAMLSYSTGESGSGADVEKVRAATGFVHERAPELLVEGPIQYDAAIEPSVATTKLPNSRVAGRATVFVFPDLNTGNNTYKAVQRSAGAVAIGPVLQGLRKPVNDLSRGALVADIVNTVAITAIQAQAR